MEAPVPALTLYNASAGSGKTHTLTGAYLKIVLQSRDPRAFRHILAITFTHEAANEMKSRILSALRAFSQEPLPRRGEAFYALLSSVQRETGLRDKLLMQRARGVLSALLHDYSNFHIRTIDGFNHRIIRSFAKDLELPANFTVELDEERLISALEARILKRIGRDDFITSLLLRFSKQKLAEGRSWQPRRDLRAVIQTLFEEKSAAPLEALARRTRADFTALHEQLIRQTTAFRTQIQQLGTRALAQMRQAGIAPYEWAGGRNGIPRYFSYLKDFRSAKLMPTATLEKNMARGKWDSAKAEADFEVRLAPIREDLLHCYQRAQQLLETGYLSHLKNQLILDNFTVFSLIHPLQTALSAVQAEEVILPIAAFNTRIHRAVRDNPTPFLYERLGALFHHFFIDEFQDTSLLQFDNLLPLLEEALSRDDTSVNLMGDPKQSIYRWRGAHPERMLSLAREEKPYPVKLESLDYNHRSRAAIVDFNNRFFRFAASQLSLPEYRALYEQSPQRAAQKGGGYVALHFSKGYSNSSFEPAQLLEIQSLVCDLKQRGFAPSEICILLRSKRAIRALADFLTDSGIRVATSESLLLKHNPAIRSLLCALQIIRQPDNPLPKAELLEHLQALEVLGVAVDCYTAQLRSARAAPDQLQSWLETRGITLPLRELYHKSLLQQASHLIQALQLSQHDAFINAFLDVIFEFEQNPPRGKSDFFSYWEENSEKFSIPSAQEPEAVKIMTIHKAKGLEFPAVICPVVSHAHDFQLHKDSDWFPLEPEAYRGFEAFYSPYSSALKAVYPARYEQYKNQIQFDNLNLLYVSFTRAVEELYILTHDEPRYLAGYLLNFLQHTGTLQAGQKRYEFGEKQPERAEPSGISSAVVRSLQPYPLQAREPQVDHRSLEALSKRSDKALKRGLVLHQIMRTIQVASDVKPAVRRAVRTGQLAPSEAAYCEKTLEQAATHPTLRAYFSEGCYSLNERDLLVKDHSDLRPDRILVESGDRVVLLDYKTGKPRQAHRDQIRIYATTLRQCGFKVRHSLLVYLGDTLSVEAVD